MSNESMGGSPRNTPQNSKGNTPPPNSNRYVGKPFATRSEMLVDQALQSATVPTQWLREMRPAARPQKLFPSRKGAGQTWTIGAVLNIDRQTPTYRSWQSGMQVQRSMIVDDGMEGTLRHSMQTQIG